MSLECVVLYRSNIHDDAPVEAVLDSNGIVVFANMDLAIAYCDANKEFRNGYADYQIVELDEL